jgi:hypothetical protein
VSVMTSNTTMSSCTVLPPPVVVPWAGECHSACKN